MIFWNDLGDFCIYCCNFHREYGLLITSIWYYHVAYIYIYIYTYIYSVLQWSKLAQTVMILTRIAELSASNLGRGSDYPDAVFWFTSFPLGKSLDMALNWTKVLHSTSLKSGYLCYRNIRRYVQQSDISTWLSELQRKSVSHSLLTCMYSEFVRRFITIFTNHLLDSVSSQINPFPHPRTPFL
jgi:hypothetical protein